MKNFSEIKLNNIRLKVFLIFIFLKKNNFFENTFKQNNHLLALTNQYSGLHRGPIDHEASSVINSISNDVIDMGATVILVAPPTTELLSRVTPGSVITQIGYGVAVGGDTDGIYGDGSASVDDSTRATTGAGQGVVVVTQGRCPAKVTGDISVGDRLAVSATGTLQVAVATQMVIAVALQASGGVGDHIIAVDVQRQEVI